MQRFFSDTRPERKKDPIHKQIMKTKDALVNYVNFDLVEAL